MVSKKHKADEIVAKLRQVDGLIEQCLSWVVYDIDPPMACLLQAKSNRRANGYRIRRSVPIGDWKVQN